MKPLISVCVPVFNSEPYLERALDSILSQSFDKKFETVIVNDGSSGLDFNGDNCDRIVKRFKKQFKGRTIYIKHDKNKGLLEARRSAIEAARSEYVTILDSDDQLLPDCLSVLYECAVKNNADIVHAGAEIYFEEADSTGISLTEEKINKLKNHWEERVMNIHEGVLKGREVLQNFLIDRGHKGLLWAKLFRRETYLEALNHIPPMNCTYLEDVLQYTFIAYHAKVYYGIKKLVYKYTLGTGVSAGRTIDNLDKWKVRCAAAGVFTVLQTEAKQIPDFDQDKRYLVEIAKTTHGYLYTLIIDLNHLVLPELRPAARDMLCEYWGADFVKKMEEQYEKNKTTGSTVISL